jgi:hypothetical protein
MFLDMIFFLNVIIVICVMKWLNIRHLEENFSLKSVKNSHSLKCVRSFVFGKTCFNKHAVCVEVHIVVMQNPLV